MLRRSFRGLLLFLSFLLVSGSLAEAQKVPCAQAKTVSDCLNEGYLSVSGTSVQAIAAPADDEVRTAVTSTVSDSSTQGASLSNFLSPFLALVDSGELGDEGERIAIQIAAKLLDDLDKDTKFQVIFNEPELFSPLRMQLDDDMMTSTVDRLERSLSDADDLTFKVSWSPVNRTYGRSIEHHRRTLRELFDPVVKGAMGASSGELLRETTRTLVDLQERFPSEDGTDFDFEKIPAEGRQQVFDAGRKLGEQNEAVKQAVSSASLFKFGKLLNNQPQIVASASYRSRDEIAGPDETSAEFRYEMGMVNLNSMRKACSGEADLLACYSGYVEDPKRSASLAAGNRVAFSLEYSDIADSSISLNEGAFSFAQSGATSLMASLTYGRYLWVRGTESARIDLSLMFDQVDNEGITTTDPNAAVMRQDRFLGSLTYIQRLNDKTGAVLGLTWANKPEFLGDVNESLGARAGLTYKILGGGR